MLKLQDDNAVTCLVDETGAPIMSGSMHKLDAERIVKMEAILSDVRTWAKEELSRAGITGHDPMGPVMTFWRDILNRVGDVL